MKKLIILLLLSQTLAGIAQDVKIYDLLSRSHQLVYCGIDFSHAQVADESWSHKSELMKSAFQEINLRFLSERGGWMMDKLSKEILPDDKVIHSLNSRYSDIPLMMNRDSIQQILAGYPINSKTGTGLVFIVTRLEKHLKKIELCPVIFDISSRSILWMKEESGTSVGGTPGVMNYWYSKVNSAIEDFVNSYQDQKDEKANKNKNKANNIFVKVLIDEVDLGFETKLSKRISLSLEGGYRQNYNDTWSNDGQPVPLAYIYRFISFRGFTLRCDFKFKVSRRSSLALVLCYQHLICPNVIYDPGGYAGDDDTEYDVWKERDDELVLQFLHYVSLGRTSSPVQFFYGFGFKVSYMNEQYSSAGYRTIQWPSNIVVNERHIQPLITFGLNIRLASF
jgi:hypothetical protein